MPNRIIYSSYFIRKAKDLKKTHVSLTVDLAALEQILIENPKQGVDLGGGLYEVRLAIKSKGKGKSGGYGIITYLINETENSVLINMLTLYDKSKESSISKKYLSQLIKDIT